MKPKPMILMEAQEHLTKKGYETERHGAQYMVSKRVGGFMSSNLIIEWMTSEEMLDMAKCLGYKEFA